jgi:hypothetical protein
MCNEKGISFDSIYFDFLRPSLTPEGWRTMDEVGVTHSYKEMMGEYESIPFVKKESVDLDHYVANKALDGLFYMVGREEKRFERTPQTE